jgi:hypothetical protein
VKIIRNGKEVDRIEKPVADANMWSNPTGPIGDNFTSDLFGDGPATGSSSSHASFLPPVASPNKPSAPAHSAMNSNIVDLKAASLEVLDEAAEAKAFAAAVAEWRGNSTTGGRSSNQEPGSPSASARVSATGTGTGPLAPSDGSGGRKVADALAASMEKEQQRVAAEMSAKMDAIKQKIADAQKEKLLERARQNNAAEASVSAGVSAGALGSRGLSNSMDFEVEDEEGEEDDYSDYTIRAEAAAAKAKQAQYKTTFNYDSRPIDHTATSSTGNITKTSAHVPNLGPSSFGDSSSDSPQNSARSAASNDSPAGGGMIVNSLMSPRGGGPPVITGVSTTLGVVDTADSGGNEDCYVVEEDSDED